MFLMFGILGGIAEAITIALAVVSAFVGTAAIAVIGAVALTWGRILESRFTPLGVSVVGAVAVIAATIAAMNVYAILSNG